MSVIQWLLLTAILRTAIASFYEEPSNLYQKAIDGGPCNGTFAQVNGTGVVSFTPEWHMSSEKGAPPDTPIPNASWALTVTEEASGKTATQLWFGNDGVKYWDDESTQFDACVIAIWPPFPKNTVDLSQDDPGDCSVMLSKECRDALTSQVAAAAGELTYYSSSGSDSNPTAGSLPGICTKVFQSLEWTSSSGYTHNFPKECSQSLGLTDSAPGPDSLYGDLTANSKNSPSNQLSYDCPINSSDGTQFYNLGGFTQDSYDLAMWQAIPVLSVYFTVANAAARQLAENAASAVLSCPRVTHVQKGSRDSARLPSGTPYSSGNPHLSSGAIAGVTVAVAAAVVIIGLCSFLFWTRQRGRQTQVLDDHRDMLEQGKVDEKPESRASSEGKRSSDFVGFEACGSPISELTGCSGATMVESPTAEIDGAPFLEAMGTAVPVELDATEKGKMDDKTMGINEAVELDATQRFSFESTRQSISSQRSSASCAEGRH